ncbi:hypothetical protein R69888_06241 [Paraburkholderia haematera]|uniref:Uncharacterized protein n=1 Tax=Paraburkholderia haematera TaxID=2793077 RepID=A0ABN7MQW7_9BURK|nr:hypothetical protein R69888_06241 [Paraburkholderia haematera]
MGERRFAISGVFSRPVRVKPGTAYCELSSATFRSAQRFLLLSQAATGQLHGVAFICSCACRLPSARAFARLNAGLGVHGGKEMLATLVKNFIR